MIRKASPRAASVVWLHAGYCVLRGRLYHSSSLSGSGMYVWFLVELDESLSSL